MIKNVGFFFLIVLSQNHLDRKMKLRSILKWLDCEPLTILGLLEVPRFI